MAHKADWIVDRIYARFMSDFDYKLHPETCNKVWDAISETLGEGSYRQIRQAIDEAKWWRDTLLP